MTRRWAVVAIGITAVLAVAAFTASRVLERGSAVARTEAAVLDDDRFVNGPAAAETLGQASKWLLDEGRACDRDRGERTPRCDVRMAAAAYVGVAAFAISECTAPGVDDARRSVLSYIRAIERFDAAPFGTAELPAPPAVPTCEKR